MGDRILTRGKEMQYMEAKDFDQVWRELSEILNKKAVFTLERKVT